MMKTPIIVGVFIKSAKEEKQTMNEAQDWKILQYTDSYGNTYISLDPEAYPELKKYIDDTLKQCSLLDLTIKYPYVPLKKSCGRLVAYYDDQPVTTYNPAYTNYFHILRSKNVDSTMSLNLKSIYSLEDKPAPLVVSLNPNQAIMNENDGIGITPNEQRSEEPIQIKQVTNWHPNKDANGNYMSAQQINNYANYTSAVASSPYYSQSSYLSTPMALQYPF